MAAVVAHDLQTPVAILLGLCARLEASGLSADQAADVDRIRAQAHAVSTAASALLEPARPGLPAEPRALDAAAIAREVVDELSVLAHERGAVAIVTAPRPAFVRCERDELASALTNLLTNALRQVHSGGCVRCSVRHVAGEVEIEVADSGAGVPQAERLALLEPFRQGAGARGNSGLGLSIVRDTARRLGGSVAAGDAPEGGAAFTLRLPDARHRPGRTRRRLKLQPA